MDDPAASGFVTAEGMFLSREQAMEEMSASALGEFAQNEARGSIKYKGWEAGQFGTVMIRLGQASDLSTFLHEFGHLGHLILESIATDPQAPAEFKQMWESTLQWWGLDQAQWSAMELEQKRPHFERWARTFEAYLMEGRAPSLSLKEAFAAFKQWLLGVYRSVLRLDANLTPEIRNVFDRLLATDEEIAQARAAMGSDFKLSREAFASDEEFATYQQAIADAADAQEAELRARVFDREVRKGKRWWRAERERFRDAAQRAVDSDPARRAHDWLGYQEWRDLPTTELSDEGETTYVAASNAMEEIPDGLPAMTIAPEALAADWPDAQLPIALSPRMDVETVLAEAMRLKRAGKDKRPARLAAFVRRHGGVRDPEGRIKDAIGSGQRRPGLINNATGKSPEEMLRLAVEAGYFGEPAAREQSDGSISEHHADSANILAQVGRQDGMPQDDILETARSWVDSFGGGPQAEARAVSVLRQQLSETRDYRRIRDLETMIAAVESRDYVRGRPNVFSARVEEAWPEIYGQPQSARSPDGGGDFPLFQDELFSDRIPTPEEFIETLIADLTNDRQVYSVRDANALADAQSVSDAAQWFEANEIDLTQDKEGIRAQIVAALEKGRDQPGMHPDDIAPWFGFDSGDALIQALSALKPRAVAIEDKIGEMAEAEHGDLGSRARIEETALLAAHAEAQARRIELELSALETATGGKKRPVGQAARAYAERQIGLMTVSQVRNYDQYLAGERRAARNAMDAAQKGDTLEASMWKQRQLVSFWLYKFARDAAEEMDRAQAYFRKFDRATIRAKIHPPLMDQIDQALEGVDLRAVTKPSNRTRQRFRAWYDTMVEEGLEHMVVVDPAFLEAVQQRPFNSLSLEDARSMRDAVRNFEHIGRRWREVLAARDQRLLDEEIALMAAAMAEVKPFELVNPNTHSPGIVESIDRKRQAFHGHLSRVEPVARAMDGNRDNGPVWNGLFRPLTEARDREETRQREAGERIEQLFSVYSAKERADMWVKLRHYPQVPNRDGSAMGRSFTKQEILSIALNTGNEYNFSALVEGDHWSEAQVRALLHVAMDERDWRFVQSLWDYVDSFWPEIEALYLKTAGVAPAKVPATPFTNRFGEWRGGYWHLDYDYGRDQRVREEVEHGAVQQALGGFRLRTQTPNGFSKARQGSGGRPVRLDLAILSEHVNEVIHDLEFRVPVLNVWRLIKHSGFREAFVRAAGQEMYDTLKPWLQYVATERMPPERMFSGILKHFRRNTPTVLMGYAIGTIAQQPAGIMATFHRVGIGRVMGKMMQLASQPWTWLEHARFINTRSAFMRNYATISQRELREMVVEANSQAHFDAVSLLVSGDAQQKLQGLGYLNRMMQRYAMFPLAYLNKWVASVAWKAAYDRALAGKVKGVDAQSEADVIAYADQLIRTTFGSGRPEDLPPVMRSSELEKLLTPAFSYFSTQYNALYNEQVPGMMRGQISVFEFMTFISWTLILQALVSQWLAGRWEPDDDESEEERDLRLALEVVQSPTAGIPLVRDISRAALQAGSTGQSFGTNVPAFGAVSSTAVGAGGAVHDLRTDGEISRRTARDLTMAAGYWFGLPSRQLWTTGSYLSDVAAGDEELPWDSDDPLDATSEALLRDTR